MDNTAISLEETANKKRCVVYDELSVGNPLYNYEIRDDFAFIRNEVNYHIKNLKLLLLYFDMVLIHPGSLTNSVNRLPINIVENLVESPDFQKLFAKNFVSLIGWGSDNKIEMADNTIEHSLLAVPEIKPKSFQKSIRYLHHISAPIFRSLSVPDSNYQDYFRVRLEESEYSLGKPAIRSALDFVDRTQDHYRYIGVLGLGSELNRSDLTLRQQRIVSELLFLSWRDYQIDTFKEVYQYQSLRNLKDPFQTMICPRTKKRALTLAYSPFVFERFILNYLTQKEYLRLLTLPIDQYDAIKNGVWQSFCTAYHDFIIQMSELLEKLDILSNNAISIMNPSNWDSIIAELRQRKGFNFTAFIHGLSAFAGIVLAIPYLGHAARLIILFVERAFGSWNDVKFGAENFRELAFVYRLQKILAN